MIVKSVKNAFYCKIWNIKNQCSYQVLRFEIATPKYFNADTIITLHNKLLLHFIIRKKIITSKRDMY